MKCILKCEDGTVVYNLLGYPILFKKKVKANWAENTLPIEVWQGLYKNTLMIVPLSIKYLKIKQWRLECFMGVEFVILLLCSLKINNIGKMISLKRAFLKLRKDIGTHMHRLSDKEKSPKKIKPENSSSRCDQCEVRELVVSWCKDSSTLCNSKLLV